MDGTFSAVPDEFSQLYVIFGDNNSDIVFPCAFLLLPDKKFHTYNHALSVLSLELGEYCPENITIDFEQAVIKAIRANFHSTKIFGCSFHWKKILYTNMGRKGCQKLFDENEDFQVGMDLLYTLCMVPPIKEDIEAAWGVVQAYFEETKLSDQVPLG